MCCGNTRSKAKCIAIFQIVTSIILLVLMALVLVEGSEMVNNAIGMEGQPRLELDFQTAWILFACGVFSLVFSITLLIGVQKESFAICGIWYYTSATLFCLSITLVIFMVISTHDVYLFAEGVITISINLYFLIVVHAYMKELLMRKKGAVKRVQGGACKTV